MLVLALQTEILDTSYCWIVHLSFLMLHNLLFFRLKKNIPFISRFFLVKLFKSQSLKLNISRTAWPILMILVSFCRILDGLSDEISLFWRCSSPLSLGTSSGLSATSRVDSNTSLSVWLNLYLIGLVCSFKTERLLSYFCKASCDLVIWLLLLKQKRMQFRPIKSRLFCWTGGHEQ